MKLKGFANIFLKYKNYLMLSFIMFLTIMVVLSSTLERKYDLKLGEVSQYTIKAPRETQDKYSTEHRIKVAQDEVAAQFNHRKEVRYDVLEKLATAKTGAFDKTGTITSGQLTVQDVVTTSSMKVEELLQLAASAEQESSHILARSLVAYTDNQNIDLAPVSSLEEKTGKGIEATINHKNVKVGKLKFVAPNSEMKPLATTTIYVSVDDELCGYVTFTDHVRPEAKETMNTLKALGVKKLMMLTGDQEKIAQRVAKEVGIDEVKADLLPQDKITALQNIPKSGHPTFMVGDGVNDAPSLATVDVGIAMGAHGSTAASESADVVILKDDLSRVSKAVTISRDTIRVARQSVLLGIAICTALMLIASTGIIPAFIGAMFQEVVDTVSILWALKARYSHEQ